MSALLLALETLAAPLAAFGVVLSFALSRRRATLAELRAELPERLGGVSPAARARLRGRRVWWLHAASAGEVAGLAPLIAALAARPDAPAILVTTTTAAGRDAARRDPRIAWAQLAPLDAWPCVARFLAAVRPERLILTETELWPTTILLAARAGARPTLINARLTRRSLPRYRAAAPLLRPALTALEAALAQSELDAQRLRAIGVPAAKVSVAGNTKYDRAGAPPAGAAERDLARLGWRDAPLFVAGSTHPIEEDVLLDAYLRCRAAAPELRMVLAPRHVERAAQVLATVRARGLAAARWTELDAAPADARVLVLDALGVLPSYWPKAAVAFVGGTLVPVGGHNLVEPAAAGAPVLFGPYTDHIEHPASLLVGGSGGTRVRDAAELAAALSGLLGDLPRARAVGVNARALAAGLRGAAARVLAVLDGPGAAPR